MRYRRVRLTAGIGVLLLSLAAVSVGSGAFNAVTSNENNRVSTGTFPTTTTVAAPTTAAPSTTASPTLTAPEPSAEAWGYGARLTWAAAANTTYDVQAGAAVDGTCAMTTFATVKVGATSPYVHPGSQAAPTPTCYRLRAVASGQQKLGSPALVTQGFFITSARIKAGTGDRTGCAGTAKADWVDCGDQVELTFNQPVDRASAPDSSRLVPATTNTVCAHDYNSRATDLIVLGARAGVGTCAPEEERDIGALSGVSLNSSSRFSSTYLWSQVDRLLTVTVRSGSDVKASSGTWTFASAGVLRTVSERGGVAVCSCSVVATGAF